MLGMSAPFPDHATLGDTEVYRLHHLLRDVLVEIPPQDAASHLHQMDGGSQVREG